MAEEGILQSSIQAGILQSLTFVAQEGILQSNFYGRRGHFAVIDTSGYCAVLFCFVFCSQIFLAQEGILQSQTFVAQEGILQSRTFVAQEGILQSPNSAQN